MGRDRIPSRRALPASWYGRQERALAQMQEDDARKTRRQSSAVHIPWATRLITRRGLPNDIHTDQDVFCRAPWRAIVAQPMMCPDRPVISLLSACSACIAFLHLR